MLSCKVGALHLHPALSKITLQVLGINYRRLLHLTKKKKHTFTSLTPLQRMTLNEFNNPMTLSSYPPKKPQSSNHEP
jgi:hypothetical protein